MSDGGVAVERWTAPDLRGRIALVTGATRGVGRAVAGVLGECGATVYASGRGTRARGPTSDLGGTVEDTADEVTARGGEGVGVRCEHGSAEDTAALFARVAEERGGLDVLVNNVVGWYGEPSVEIQDELDVWRAPMWERDFASWDGNMHVGVRSHALACHFGIPLMLGRPGAAVIFTNERPNEEPGPDLGIDMRAHATARLALALARQLRGERIPAIAVYPGFPRIEAIVRNWERGHPYFKGWSEADFLARTESPAYAGRAIAMLVADANAMERSGQTVGAHELARAYDFTDIDGRQPGPFA